ncbi:semaphorin-6D-like isoform X2 [Phycodurus eques]|uniref:semaphorin-6D-like isoform X2 n=1 Tax=Phycodurus eques TaxID=693459 RepID=UPI002ACEEE6B|nr:semaphorin-6D-like isoform X2 [Phycodurus eques]
MSPTHRSPERTPPRTSSVLLLFASCFLCASSSFPRDLDAISVVEESGDLVRFRSLLRDNDTLRLGLDFQAMMRVNRMLFITARDHVFAVNLTTAAEAFVPQMKLTWRSTDVSKCAVRGKNSDECYNYIKVLVPRDDETLFVCGTNAFNPSCRNYKTSTLEQVGSDLPGQARCPFESGGDFYSATVTDFLASDSVIYRSLGEGRPVLRTVKYDSKWLREPRFLHAVDYGSYVYFFLSEIAAEYTTLGKVVFSRVARVCKNDNGGSPRVLDKYWTSFLKARLNCSLPGDSLFYFDVLQSLTGVLQINGRPTVLAVFTTQANSIPGSAVCAFYMDDVEKVFSGKFKEQRSSDASWTAVPEDAVPRPRLPKRWDRIFTGETNKVHEVKIPDPSRRPGTCAGDGPAADGPAADFKSSVDFPDETLSFIKSFPLMDDAVPAVNRRPFYTRTASRSKLTQIAADVSAGPRNDRTVVFLGSEDGRVAKVLASTLPEDTAGSKLLEDIHVYDRDKCDLGIQEEDRRVLALELDKEHHALFVAFSSCLVRVPLSRCGRHGACKRACLASRDPYCIWLRTGSCADMAPGFKAGFEQDIEGDHPDVTACHADILATSRDRDTPADVTYSVAGADDDPASHVHYTLLIACVLLAFSLGATLSGLLAARFRRNGKFGKDPEAPPPRASSPPPPVGLPDAAPAFQEDKTGASPRPKTYVSRDADDRAPERIPAAEPRVGPKQLASSRVPDGDPSAPPTPNSGPESRRVDDPAPFAAVTTADRVTPPVFPPPGRHGNRHTPSGAGADASAASALDELLKHIHQVSAQGVGGGIRVLTSTSGGLHHHHHHSGKTRAHSFNRSHHRGHQQPVSETQALPLNANTAIPEAIARPRGTPLIKMGSGLPRRHNFHQWGAPPLHRFLVRINTNADNGPPSPPAARGGRQRVAAARACLTRQHSYSEGVHAQRSSISQANGVRRAVSLKPKVPPKPLFLPNMSASSGPSGC